MGDVPKTDEKAVTPLPDRVVEPEIVPTRIVNRIFGGGYFGGLFDVILAESRVGYDAQGKAESLAMIVARIRFDREFAKSFHSELGKMLAATEPPPKGQVN